MFEPSPRERMTVRVIRDSTPDTETGEWIGTSPEDRIEAVWILTRLCLAWNEQSDCEPRLQELLLTFNAHKVEYLIVGAHALAVYGHVRATKDLDVWVRPDRENASKVLKALSAFGAPLGDLTLEDLIRAGTIFQIGVPPLRIDIITSIDGVDFTDAWPERLETTFGGASALIISRHHLITNKRAAARLQDLADVERLEASDENH